MTLKRTLLSVPSVGAAARKVKRAVQDRRFAGSGNYWEQRYQAGGNSGGGSYGRLAEFKAEVLNGFVAGHDVASVVEMGSGDGAQLQLADYPRYTGVDVAQTCIDSCRRLFDGDTTKTFVRTDDVAAVRPHELSLSLDVVYHLVEDEVFEPYMRELFRLGTRFVIVYASDFDGPHDSPHVRHRNFTRWVEDNISGWVLDERIPNRYPATADSDPTESSFADFYIFRPVA